MYKNKFIIGGTFIVLFLSICFIIENVAYRVGADDYTSKEAEAIKKEVKSSEVFARTNKKCTVYENADDKTPVDTLDKNAEVEILMDKSEKWYCINMPVTSKQVWIKSEDINIPENPPTNDKKMKKKQMELFVNVMNFESNTDYFVWVDIDRQVTNVFKGEKGNWKLEKSLTCATGKNSSPTVRGSFEIGDRGEWFYTERLQSGAKYWIRFNGSYLFHSVAMDKNKNITDDVLGERRSSGCVRMGLKDIKWFYDTVPKGTKVFIN